MDSLYFFKKANLLEKVTLDKVLNSAHNEDRTEERSILEVVLFLRMFCQVLETGRPEIVTEAQLVMDLQKRLRDV